MYVSGYQEDDNNPSNSIRHIAKVWKNGVATSLTNTLGGNDAYAYSVFVSNNDVYVAGDDTTGAKIWKNGVVSYTTTSGPAASAKSVFVVN